MFGLRTRSSSTFNPFPPGLTAVTLPAPASEFEGSVNYRADRHGRLGGEPVTRRLRKTVPRSRGGLRCRTDGLVEHELVFNLAAAALPGPKPVVSQ